MVRLAIAFIQHFSFSPDPASPFLFYKTSNYDTYRFPLDLTELILSENNMTVDTAEFEKEMAAISEEQGIGTEQINSAINEPNKITQQAAAHGEELAGSADHLHEIVSTFKGRE